MKIYTRTGDDGATGLLGGIRVSKNDLRIAAYGSIDELNAFLGVCRASGTPADVDQVLVRLQHDMFALGAELASPGKAPRGAGLVDDSDVARLEAEIDHFEARLPELHSFILPAGALASCWLHVARSICRRAERELVALTETAPVRPVVLQYVNRVSDLLFVLARWSNAAAGVPDMPWEKKG